MVAGDDTGDLNHHEVNGRHLNFDLHSDFHILYGSQIGKFTCYRGTLFSHFTDSHTQ